MTIFCVRRLLQLSLLLVGSRGGGFAGSARTTVSIPKASSAAACTDGCFVSSVSKDVVVGLSEEGVPMNITVAGVVTVVADGGIHFPAAGDLVFIRASITAGGHGVAFAYNYTTGNCSASVVSTFTGDAASPNDIEWTVTMEDAGPGALWTTSLDIWLQLDPSRLPDANPRLWQPWAAPGCPSCLDSNPLQAQPMRSFAGQTWTYGSGISVPLIGVLFPATDSSFSLGVRLAPHLLNTAGLSTRVNAVPAGDGWTSHDGQGDNATLALAFQIPPGYRLGGGAPPVRLAFSLSGAKACTRDILRVYHDRQPEYFVPPNPNVHFRASGMGTYAATQGPLTQEVDGRPLLETLRHTGYVTSSGREPLLQCTPLPITPSPAAAAVPIIALHPDTLGRLLSAPSTRAPR